MILDDLNKRVVVGVGLFVLAVDALAFHLSQVNGLFAALTIILNFPGCLLAGPILIVFKFLAKGSFPVWGQGIYDVAVSLLSAIVWAGLLGKYCNRKPAA